MTKLVNPDPLFLDGRGAMLDAGYVYIGTAGTDPEILANQLAVFWDKALTLPAAQPLRTLGGFVVNGHNVSNVYFAATDYSITTRDADGNLVRFVTTAFDLGGTSYQPLDADLTAIAAVASQTTFGQSGLADVNAAGLRTRAGLGTIATFDETTSAQFRSNTSGKVLSTDKVWGAAAAVALTPGASVAVDLNSGFNFTLAMGGNYTLSNPTNAKAGQEGVIEITQDATGSRTLAYGVNWLFAGAVDPSLSTAANAKDALFYKVLADGSSILGSLVKGLG